MLSCQLPPSLRQAARNLEASRDRRFGLDCIFMGVSDSEVSSHSAAIDEPPPRAKRRLAFPSAVTTLALVTLLVWVAALFLPAGSYRLAPDGSPIPGTYHQIPSPLSFGEKLQQLILSPVNGLYGLQKPVTGFVGTEGIGRM